MSHHCHDEHEHGHSHSHSHDDPSHTHDDDLPPADHLSLYSHIDFPKITVLNEDTPHSGRAIIQKPYSDRLLPSPPSALLLSSSDDQLLIHIPFTTPVRLHSLLLRTTSTPTAPKTLHLYANREGLDFEEAENARPTQVVETPMTEEVFEVPLRRASWNGVRSLTVFVTEGWGGDNVEIAYLACRGDWLKVGGAPIGILYEAAADPRDHKLKNGETWEGGVGLGGAGGRGY